MIAHIIQKSKEIVAVTIVCGMMNSAAMANEFEDFHESDRSSKASYAEISVVMAIAIAAQSEPDRASCIDRWYSGNASDGRPRINLILDAIDQQRDYHPMAVILGLIHNACGAHGSGPLPE